MTGAAEFRGETALVTGAASGIGEGVARRLAALGAGLVLSDVDAAKGAALAGELREAGATVRFVPSDLADPAGADALLRAVSEGPAPAMFVHSASPARRNAATVAAVSEAEWDAMQAINLRSGFFLGRAIGERMAAARLPGRMVFVTSLHAGTPRNLPHYSAAKAGQVMVAREMARFFGPAGIRVNAVAPGAIPFGGFDGDFGALARKIPLRRVGTPDDIARVIAALLSNEVTGYVTGAVIPVDGGLGLFNWIDAAEATVAP